MKLRYIALGVVLALLMMVEVAEAATLEECVAINTAYHADTELCGLEYQPVVQIGTDLGNGACLNLDGQEGLWEAAGTCRTPADYEAVFGEGKADELAGGRWTVPVTYRSRVAELHAAGRIL